MEFQIYTNENKKYVWDLKEDHNFVVATSAIEYEKESDAIHSIDLMIRNKNEYRGFVEHKDSLEQKNEEWFWYIKHDSGKTIAKSPESFKNRADANKSILSLMNINKYKIVKL